MQYSETEFENLYLRSFEPSVKLAFGLLHDEDEARDVVHEVLVKLWESKSKPDNPCAYILRAVRNESLSRIRKIDVRERIKARLMLEPPHDGFDFEQRDREVRIALQTLLTVRERQVVDKVYSEGLSYKESAESLGVSVAAINKNLVTAMKKLRIHFKIRKS